MSWLASLELKAAAAGIAGGQAELGKHDFAAVPVGDRDGETEENDAEAAVAKRQTGGHGDVSK